MGYRLDEQKVSAIILKNNNLHVEIIINPSAFSVQGAVGISDIIVEVWQFPQFVITRIQLLQ